MVHYIIDPISEKGSARVLWKTFRENFIKNVQLKYNFDGWVLFWGVDIVQWDYKLHEGRDYACLYTTLSSVPKIMSNTLKPCKILH